MRIYDTAWIRRLVLPVLARVNIGDITIRHHYTGHSVRLHSFKHKGYWFYGKQREASTMLAFSRVIGAGDTAFEVGGHVGYISLYFSHLVGPLGKVVVFEPGPNNLPYITANLRGSSNVSLEALGVGNHNGMLPFFVEELTGQNNSFIADFPGLRVNERMAGVRAERTVVDVSVVTLDHFCEQRCVEPDFIKVDVEGFEFQVLEGMVGLLSRRAPRLMVEVQSNEVPIYKMLAAHGYVAFTPDGHRLNSPDQLKLNTFFVHQADERGIECITQDMQPLTVE